MASTHQTLLTSIDSRWSTRCTCKDVKAASLRAYQARCRLFWAVSTVQGVRYRAADGSSSDRLLPKGRDARREHGQVNPEAGDVQQKLVSSTVSVEQAQAVVTRVRSVAAGAFPASEWFMLSCQRLSSMGWSSEVQESKRTWSESSNGRRRGTSPDELVEDQTTDSMVDVAFGRETVRIRHLMAQQPAKASLNCLTRDGSLGVETPRTWNKGETKHARHSTVDSGSDQSPLVVRY
ncbi:hypothetical protein K456DRAFT_1232614 [Colletotrichum gloeosporioides 23]|nr:hypothetical protein K456DRAFT_1232614 [Colletotrichum gloeosporioides 23]